MYMHSYAFSTNEISLIIDHVTSVEVVGRNTIVTVEDPCRIEQYVISDKQVREITTIKGSMQKPKVRIYRGLISHGVCC